MKELWQCFWNDYLDSDPVTESDLFRQVAQTINKKPIPPEMFRRMCDRIVQQLQLSSADHLLEFCCGNGLFSYELATHVSCLTGIDFAPRLIKTAQQMKLRQNTVFLHGDATAPLSTFIDNNTFPNKFLINYSLAYFKPAQLDTILGNVLDRLGNRPFLFLVTGIPNFDLKWNFYNTPERRAKHLEDEKKPGDTNDGLGRWWRVSEIEQICLQRGLVVSFKNQPPELSNYRIDALISSSAGKPLGIEEDQTHIVEDFVSPFAAQKPNASMTFLRSLDESDIECCFRWHNDPRLYDTLGDDYQKITRQSEGEWLRSKSTRSRTESNFAICLNPGGEHIGNIYLRNINGLTRTAELHIFIGERKHRGKGYGQEAVSQLLHIAFRVMNLDRVILNVLADNNPAIKVYKKCGFELERCLKNHLFKLGQYKDVLVMGISFEKFKQQEEEK